MRAKKQRNLPFEGKREQNRLDRIEQLLGDIPKVKTAARYFDEKVEREATTLARRA